MQNLQTDKSFEAAISVDEPVLIEQNSFDSDYDYELEEFVGQQTYNDTVVCLEDIRVSVVTENSLLHDSVEKQLAPWPVQCTIFHSHIKSLLTLLKSHDCFLNLPSDARTLLNTPNIIKVTEMYPDKFF